MLNISGTVLSFKENFRAEAKAVAQMTSKITIARYALNLHNYLKQLDRQRSHSCYFRH